jgi:hypothetical protein
MHAGLAIDVSFSCASQKVFSIWCLNVSIHAHTHTH